MGHQAGQKPGKSAAWKTLAGLLGAGAQAGQLANATMGLIEKGFRLAAREAGVIESVWWLMRLPTAARAESFRGALGVLGLHFPGEPSSMELVGAVSGAVDRQLLGKRGRTDLGEMAQSSLCETLIHRIQGQSPAIFGITPVEVKAALAATATSKQFGILAREFFGRWTYKALDSFLSRVSAQQIGRGGGFPTLADRSEFQKTLKEHCRNVCGCLEEYGGDWWSKENYQTDSDIARERVRDFLGYAVEKLIGALRPGADRAA